MNTTTNFQLCQWDPEDRILRTDFNADNVKIDAALGELAASAAAAGNCKIEYGSYTGTGGYGSGSPTRLTFSERPLLVAVLPADRSLGTTMCRILMVQGATHAYSFQEYSNSCLNVTWSGSQVSWYSASDDYQFNRSGVTFFYVGLLAAGGAA